ncbi:MAG: heparin lyase I family protein [Solirubrobacterales bacterium]
MHRSETAGKRHLPQTHQRIGLASNAAVTRPRPQRRNGALLDAGFERGLQNWNTAGVGEAVPGISDDIVRSGVRSSNVALSGSQDRSELILGGNGGGSTSGMIEFREGDEYYYAFSINVQSMVYGQPGAHNLIMQFKSDGEGSPAFGLQLWDYEGDEGSGGGRGLWSSGEAMDGDRFLAPLSEQAWHDVVIHFRASSTDAGFYEVFLDGQLVDARSGVSMIVPGHSYAYIKNGLYRNGGSIPGTAEIRLDAARLGRNLSVVAPS